jgi:uncharacterized protein (TIGR02145 family)
MKPSVEPIQSNTSFSISIIRTLLRGAGSIVLLFICATCDDDNTQSEIKKEKLSGYIQKGPFINGTTLTISELNSDLSQTGKTFSTVINDNTGSFEFRNITLNSAFIECKADGFYFNEVDGKVSSAPLTLWALSDIKDKNSLNVNLLTHLERDRVKFLVGTGKNFKEAKTQASKEVLAIFGFSEEVTNAESLDISLDGDDNSILLAISVIVQGTRAVGAVSELIANISSDLTEDGVLTNESIKKDLQTDVLKVSLFNVRQNIEDRYKDLGLDIHVSDFESHVNAYAEESIYGTVKDVDGNEYRTVKIGGQWWTADNLKTTHYADGNALINGTPVSNLKGDVTTKYYFTSPYPAPSTTQVPKYGYYYTFAAVMNGASTTNSTPSGVQGVCPTDWHVPSFAEYQILDNYIKSKGYESIDIADNPFGFNLEKAGVRGYDNGSYAPAGYNYDFWTTNGSNYGTGSCCSLESGRSVRCVKN